VDWQGSPEWYYPCDFHHDFDILSNGRVVILAGARTRVFGRPDLFVGCADGLSIIGDHFLEIDPGTFRCSWRWHAHEHVEELRAVGVVFPRPIDERSKNR